MQSNNFKIVLMLLFIATLFFVGCDSKDEVQIKKDVVANSEKENKIKLIQLSENQKADLKIKTIKIESITSNLIISAPAIVSPAPNFFFVVSAPVHGRIVSIYAHEGEAVKKGQLILEMESSQFGNLIADFLQSKSEENFAKDNLDRVKILVDKKISSASQFERATADYARAQASANASYSKLKSIGISNSELSKLENGQTISTRIKIYSPLTGVMDQHLIEMGQAVTEYQKLATIINPSKVLVKGYVSPNEGNYVKAGDDVTVSLKNDLTKSIKGKINTINPGLDENNKSIVVNIMINTKNNWPRTGENVKLDISSTASSEALIIPLSAVVYDGDNPIVFVKHSDGNFEQRQIKIKEINANNAIVASGLGVKDEIAISELFTLKALSKFDEFSE